jgi:hypothetical protein
VRSNNPDQMCCTIVQMDITQFLWPTVNLSFALLHSELMEPYTPLRLKDGDIIALGATELAVRLSEVADDQDGSQS